MSPELEGERPSPEEEALDAMIRAARPRTHAGFVRPADEDIWAYVSGTATDRQVETVRAALRSSEAFRREILEVSEDVEAAIRPDVQASFARARVGKAPAFMELLARSSRSREVRQREDEGRGVAAALGRLCDQLWGLARKPAFAYAFMLALMAYPAYRWLAGGEGRAPSMLPERAVFPSQLLFVWPEPDVTMRSVGEKLPELVLDPRSEIVDVTVWAPASLSVARGRGDGPRYAADLSDEHGVIWSTRDFRGLVTIEGQYAFRFTLSRKVLRPGVVTVRVEPIDPDHPGEEPPVVARFRVIAKD